MAELDAKAEHRRERELLADVLALARPGDDPGLPDESFLPLDDP